jgi:trigger factor
MKTELTDVSAVRKRIAVEVPASEVAAVFDKLVRRARRNIKIPGFRDGKAPLELVKARIGDALEHEAAEAIVEEYGDSACRQEGLAAVYSEVELPEGVHHLPHPHEHEDYRFALLVDVLPAIEPQDYLGQEVARPNVEVEVEEVQRELEQLRQTRGEFKDAGDRAAAAGDYVGIEIEGRDAAGEVVVPTEKRVIRLGDERNRPEFEQNLAGRRRGDTLRFAVTFPDETPDEKLAGKSVTFTGTVERVTQVEVPEWTDELAKSFGEGIEGYADLREKIKAGLTRRKTHEADGVARDRLLEKLLDRHPFDVPEVMVEQEVRDRLERLGRRLAAQGLDPDKLEVDWKKIVEEERERARRSVRAELLLDAIADKEQDKVVVSQQDVDAVVEMMAAEAKVAPSKMRQALQKDGRMPSLARELRRQKCLDWVYAQAHIS